MVQNLLEGLESLGPIQSGGLFLRKKTNGIFLPQKMMVFPSSVHLRTSRGKTAPIFRCELFVFRGVPSRELGKPETLSTQNCRAVYGRGYVIVSSQEAGYGLQKPT